MLFISQDYSMTQNLSKTNSHEESVTIQTISDSLEPSIISSMFTIIKKNNDYVYYNSTKTRKSWP